MIDTLEKEVLKSTAQVSSLTTSTSFSLTYSCGAGVHCGRNTPGCELDSACKPYDSLPRKIRGCHFDDKECYEPADTRVRCEMYKYITKVKIYTDGGHWEFEVGGTICDPDEFDWEIKRIEVLVPPKPRKVIAPQTQNQKTMHRE